VAEKQMAKLLLALFVLAFGFVAFAETVCVDGNCEQEQRESFFRRKSEPLRVNVYFFSNGGNCTGPPAVSYSLFRTTDTDTLFTAVKTAGRALGIYNWNELLNAKVYNKFGRVITHSMTVQADDFLYIVRETDKFVWPAPYIGYTVPLLDVPSPDPETVLQLTVVSLRPRLFEIENFISDEEADAVIGLAKPKMAQAGLIVNNKPLSGTEEVHDNGKSVRTSLSTFLNPRDGKCIADLDERNAKLTFTPLEAKEQDPMQVVYYQTDGHYYLHFDALEEQYHPDNQQVKAGVQRMATVFYYLNNVEEGGETFFVHGNGTNGVPLGGVYSNADCDIGLKITPKKGKAVLWYNLLPEGLMEGAIDPYSLHAGCDVLKGEKWGGNKWVYNKKHNGRLWW